VHVVIRDWVVELDEQFILIFFTDIGQCWFLH